MLRQVVRQGGIGIEGGIAGYHVAGKTGAAKEALNGEYSKDRHTSIFAGMAPATRPRLVMVVTIDEPNNGVYYGGEVAALRFRWVKAPRGAELARSTQTLARRIGRHLERQGLLESDAADSDLAGSDAEPMEQLPNSPVP